MEHLYFTNVDDGRLVIALIPCPAAWSEAAPNESTVLERVEDLLDGVEKEANKRNDGPSDEGRRGTFRSFNVGLSFGGGQMVCVSPLLP